jgi:hypothetical protein
MRRELSYRASIMVPGGPPEVARFAGEMAYGAGADAFGSRHELECFGG